MSLRKYSLLVISSLVFVFLFQLSIVGGASSKEKKKSKIPSQITTNDTYAPICINNIFNYYGNNGDGSFNPFSTDDEGFEFPKGTYGDVQFEDGIVWGGFQQSILKVGGSTYNHGLQAGKILISGTSGAPPVPDDPVNAKYHIYHVRPDINPHTNMDSAIAILSSGEYPLISRYQAISSTDIYNQYISDWNNWPAADGAPYMDVNNNGVYDAGIDIPGIPGADETIWYVANDLDPARTVNLYGSQPIGVEMQKIIWAYNQSGPLAGTIFISTKLINKSYYPIDSMFISQWADPDLGGSRGYNDNYVACDTSLGLGYVYYGSATDPLYGIKVPAGGFTLLQGPMIHTGNNADTAIFDFKRRSGFKNLGMTAFNFFINGNSTYSDPPFTADGTRQWYNLMNGLVGHTGAQYIDPTTGHATKYLLSGDPVTDQGWVESSLAPPNDQRMCLITGPITMAAGDTQEVVVANTAAQGADRFSSITLLRNYIAKVRGAYLYHAPIAAIEPVNPIYPIGSPIAFHSSASVILGGSITGTDWHAEGPDVSSFVSGIPGPYNAFMQPGVAGTYKITFVSHGPGAADSAYVQFQVTDNTPPVDSIQMSPQSITIGDTLSLDGSATHDNDGDSLTYGWSVGPDGPIDPLTSYDTLRGTLINRTLPRAKYVPIRASSPRVSLTVKDSFFTSNASKPIIIQPIQTQNILEVNNYFNVNSYSPWDTVFRSGGGFYYHGPIRQFPDGSVWTSLRGTLLKVNFGDAYNLTQYYQSIDLQGGVQWYRNFYVSGNLVFGTDYPQHVVSVLTTDGHSQYVGGAGHIQPFQISSRSDSIAYDLFYRSPYLYIAFGTAGIYEYDCTTPALPNFVQSVTDGAYGFKWTNLCNDGNYIYSVYPATSQLAYVNISNPAHLTYGLIPLIHPYTGIKKLGQYFYLFKSDTIGVYDLSNLGNPVIKSEIPVPKTLNVNNIITDVSGNDQTLMVGTAEGVYFYTVTNIAAPVLSDKFITGYGTPNVFLGNKGVAASSWGRFLSGGYEGINTFQVTSVLLGVSSFIQSIPSDYRLLQNYPNPFNPTTKIEYTLPEKSKVMLKVYNLLGELVATLVDETQPAGIHHVAWDGSQLASGVYFYRLNAGSFVQTKKFVLLK
ncbi:MAG: T9SS type A sorting domain-containing protein [Bacteroidota bacterium]